MALEEHEIPTLHDFLDQKEGVNDERFVIRDDNQANWALRKLRQMQEKKEENIKLANGEIEKIEEWLNSANDYVDRSMDYFQSLLAEYAFEKRKVDKKFKTLKLPNGKIMFRKQQPRWEYDDKKVIEVLKLAKKTDLIRIKEELDKSAIKKAYIISGNKAVDPDTGEVLEGVTIEQREDAFKWEVSE